MEKKISTFQLILTYCGCYLGAGFVSGQELWQYFGSFGRKGIPGMICSLILMGIMLTVLLILGRKIGAVTVEKVILSRRIPALQVLFSLLTCLMLFTVSCIMLAGIGALGQQLFSLPVWVLSLAAALLAAVFVYFGLSGMVSVFSFAVPILVICGLIISLKQLGSVPSGKLVLSGGEINPMLGNWGVSALNYAALNYFSSIALLIPLTGRIKSGKSLLTAVSVSTVLLIVLALCLILAMDSAVQCSQDAIPMLSIAMNLGKIPADVYALLLFLGMFGNAVASLVAVLFYFTEKSRRIRRHRPAVLIILVVISFLASLVGFGDLIASLYPIFGYVGLLMMIMVLIHFLQKVCFISRKDKK